MAVVCLDMNNDDRPIPLMNNPTETGEYKRLLKIVEDGLGEGPYTVTKIKAAPNGELLLTLSPKMPQAE